MKQNDPSPGKPASTGTPMTSAERRATAALAGIFTLRMLGLFMILPVFSLYADHYTGHTPLLIGLAIGIYGLTQAAFQIPFGMLSDRIGRKRVITAGLLIFAAGSVVAALADSIWDVILGRALQGLGAIGAAVIALTADLTREEQRTKAMALIGVSIGLAFALAMVISHAVTGAVGLGGLFWLTAVLALAGIVVLHTWVPTPSARRFHRDVEPVPAQFARILKDRQLLRLDAGILILHLTMTATFVVLPLSLAGLVEIADAQWKMYVPVLILSVALMIPFVMYADRQNRLKHIFVGAIVVLAAAEAGLAGFGAGLYGIALLMVAYFTAFNVLEASLPSLVSRLAPSDMKGTALGVYSTSQYLGAFIGGVLGGWVFGEWGIAAVFGSCAALLLAWVGFAIGMRNPRALSTHLLNVGAITPSGAQELTDRLLRVDGVAEAVVVAEDGIAYLKVDRKTLDRGALRAFSSAPA